MKMTTGRYQSVLVNQLMPPRKTIVLAAQDIDFHFVSAAEYKEAVANSWRFG